VDRDLRERRRALEKIRTRSTPEPEAAPLDRGVRASWQRCEPVLTATLAAAPLEPDEIEDRWEASPIRLAAPELVDELTRVAEDGDFVAAVTDASGRILWSWGGRTMSRLAERVNFVPGGRWDELSAGTNAPGLALITAEPAIVFSMEHWCEAVHDWVCYAAPVRARDGTPVGVIDLSTKWEKHTPLGLSTVTALARIIELQMAATVTPTVDVELALLGPTRLLWRGTPLMLPLRQLEILATLVGLGSASLDTLHAYVYGDRPVQAGTLKAEISHLRRALDGRISSRPYRLTVDIDADFVAVDQHLRHGRVGAASQHYRGQLLPESEAPYIVDLRRHIDAALRAGLLRDGRPSDLLAYTDVHPWDTEILERAVALMDDGDPLLPVVTARLVVAGSSD